MKLKFWKHMTAAVLSLGLGAASPDARADGTVLAWGRNFHGQLGDGTRTNRWTAVQASGLANTMAIACGAIHSLAVKADGTVWTSGYNGYGRLGDGSTTDREAPVPVLGLSGVTAVAGGYEHSLALKSDGTVWAWGYNSLGQLGDGTTTERWTPVPVSGLTGVTAIACGWDHSLAVKSDGTVWAWGSNWGGQLGDGTTTDRWSPVQVSDLAGVIAVAAGNAHSLATRSDGSLWAWGSNDAGQLGDGTNGTLHWTPFRIVGLTGVTGIAAGHRYSLALRDDGTVWAWGDNRFGLLGNGTTVDRNRADRIVGLSNVTAIAGGYDHALALQSDGSVWAWGNNGYGQIGDGTTANRWIPVQVVSVAGAVAIAGGNEHSRALLQHLGTALYTVDRTGTVGEPVRFKAYLKRTTDNAWVVGRAVTFRVGGSAVGSAVTSSLGEAYLDWIITGGSSERTIAAEYAGDPQYYPSEAWATLTSLTFDTETFVPDRSGELADSVLLRAYLNRAGSYMWLPNKPVAFAVNGVAVGSATTNENGRAQLVYVIPPLGGPGDRIITATWVGDGGYRASIGAATLHVAKAPAYVWFASRSAQRGTLTYLRAYVRSLPDYAWLPNKTIGFTLNGTYLGAAVTDSGGRASYLLDVTPAWPLGELSMLATFTGDGSYLPHGGSAVLTVVP